MKKDITANRHRGNKQSKEAFKRIESKASKIRAKVFEACGRKEGVTCRELAAEWGVGMNVISGRFSELKKAGHITQDGVRDGCGIYVHRGL